MPPLDRRDRALLFVTLLLGPGLALVALLHSVRLQNDPAVQAMLRRHAQACRTLAQYEQAHASIVVLFVRTTGERASDAEAHYAELTRDLRGICHGDEGALP